jgi:hypothetical protein
MARNFTPKPVENRQPMDKTSKPIEPLAFAFSAICAPAKFVEIELQIFSVQAVAGAADESLRVGNEGVNSMEMVGIGDGIEDL